MFNNLIKFRHQNLLSHFVKTENKSYYTHSWVQNLLWKNTKNHNMFRKSYKTKAKIVHKNVSQSCHKIRKSESYKVTHHLHSIKVVQCDISKSYFILRKICNFILVLDEIFIKIG